MNDGGGHGFAFIAPTVRRSKVTGETVAYRWVTPPDLDTLRASMRALFDKYAGTAIAIKSQHAYERTLRWQPVAGRDTAAATDRPVPPDSLT